MSSQERLNRAKAERDDALKRLAIAGKTITRLKRALRPFATAGADIPSNWPDDAAAIRWKAGKHPWIMTVGDFRRAPAEAEVDEE